MDSNFRFLVASKSAKLVLPAQMCIGLLRTSLRSLTWVCVVLLTVLSLTPLEEIQSVRIDLPGQVEHIIAYASSTAIAIAGYGLSLGAALVIGCFWLYAGILEYLQNFAPGGTRHLWISQHRALGALCGGVAVLLLWRCRSAMPAWRNAA
jgi:VanZ family protein